MNTQAIAAQVVATVKSFVAKAIEGLDGRVKALEDRPAPDFSAALAEAVKAMPVPKDGEPGKDADPEVIAQQVKAAVEAMPKPADGTSVTLADVAPLIEEQVKVAVGALPPPKDGTSVTIEDVAPVIAQEVAKAVEALPKPKDGEAGTSVAPDAVKALVDEAVAALPAPAAGKDADPDVTRKMVEDMLVTWPKPENGKNITPEDVAPLLAELVAKAVEALPKPKDGESVPLAEVGRMVSEAVAKAVAEIPAPRDGEPGRDAAHMDVLPGIDEEKQYRRGTFATHKGGLWRSCGVTDGMRNWECLVDGIASQEIKQVDERTFEIVTVRSSGVETKAAVIVPTVIDRGVFREGQPYTKGDGVTWGGSFFIAQKDAAAGKPGESDSWRLSVKRGRDGKDGVMKPAEPQGPVHLGR